MAPRKRPERLRTFDVPDLHGGTSVKIDGFEEDDQTGALIAHFHTVVAPDPWRISGTVRLDTGQLQMTTLCIEPNPFFQDSEGERGAPGAIIQQNKLDVAEPGGITSALLRAIHLGPLLRGIRAELMQHPQVARAHESAKRRTAEQLGIELPTITSEYLEVADRAAGMVGEPPKRGRRGYGDEFYRRVARAYLALQDEGWGKGILNELASREGRPRDTVATWVRVARDRDFLTAGTPGRAGAGPGPRLQGADDERDRS